MSISFWNSEQCLPNEYNILFVPFSDYSYHCYLLIYSHNIFFKEEKKSNSFNRTRYLTRSLTLQSYSNSINWNGRYLLFAIKLCLLSYDGNHINSNTMQDKHGYKDAKECDAEHRRDNKLHRDEWREEESTNSTIYHWR